MNHRPARGSGTVHCQMHRHLFRRFVTADVVPLGIEFTQCLAIQFTQAGIGRSDQKATVRQLDANIAGTPTAQPRWNNERA